MREIIKPEIGIKTNTNNVSFTLILNIVIIAKTMVSGSLIISSNIAKNEFCTSPTSPSMRAITSPLRFSE